MDFCSYWATLQSSIDEKAEGRETGNMQKRMPARLKDCMQSKIFPKRSAHIQISKASVRANQQYAQQAQGLTTGNVNPHMRRRLKQRLSPSGAQFTLKP